MVVGSSSRRTMRQRGDRRTSSVLGELRQDSLWLVQVTIGYGRASKVCVGGSP